MSNNGSVIEIIDFSYGDWAVTKVEFMILYNQKLNEKAFESVMYLICCILFTYFLAEK